MPTPIGRGAMLRHCAAVVRPGGLFYLAVPRRCVYASAVLSPPRFEALLRRVGFDVDTARQAPEKKVLVYLCTRRAGGGGGGGAAAAATADDAAWAEAAPSFGPSPPVLNKRFKGKGAGSEFAVELPP